LERRAFVFGGLGAIAAGLTNLPLLATARSSQAKLLLAPLPEAAISEFGHEIEGAIFLPGAPEYEKLRKGFAAEVDLHPALIVHVMNSDDVSKAVLFAKTHKLPLAIRCGGHSYAGYNTCQGGLVVDMSGLNEIVLADDHNSLRAGGGVLAHGVEQAGAKVGRVAVMGQCPSVGIGGFLTGGGVGPLMNKYGLGCDNVIEAEIVLADGRVVRASSSENTDLFWAIRGGGGNFGVVTAFKIALHPVTQVYAGMIGVGSNNIGDLLRIMHDLGVMAMDELSTIGVLSADGQGGFQMWLQVCYLGTASGCEKALSPLRLSKGLIADQIKSIDIFDLESQVPMEIPPVRERRMAGFVNAFSEEVVQVFNDAAAMAPGPFDLTIVPIQGAVVRVPLSASAFPMRAQGFAIGLSCPWEASGGAEKADQWLKTTAGNLRPFGGGAYVNIMERDASSDEIADAYGQNYHRLAQLKARYDPTNLFSINQNIMPQA
jgi:hypothetical protein